LYFWAVVGAFQVRYKYFFVKCPAVKIMHLLRSETLNDWLRLLPSLIYSLVVIFAGGKAEKRSDHFAVVMEMLIKCFHHPVDIMKQSEPPFNSGAHSFLHFRFIIRVSVGKIHFGLAVVSLACFFNVLAITVKPKV